VCLVDFRLKHEASSESLANGDNAGKGSIPPLLTLQLLALRTNNVAVEHMSPSWMIIARDWTFGCSLNASKNCQSI
jgi:hypothetical protein